MFSRKQVIGHILKKQHLSQGDVPADLLRVVDDLVGLHATSPTAPYLSLHARLPSFVREDLDRELYELRSLMRLKVMRGTVFVLSRALAPICYGATRAMTLQRDRRYLALDRAVYEETARRVLGVLPERCLTVAELRSLLGSDVDLAPVVALLCDEGYVVRDRPSGSWRSTAFTYRLWRDVFPAVELSTYEEKQAIRLLVRRYFGAYGPATVDDAAWWTGLGKGAVRQAMTEVGDDLVEVRAEGFAGPLFMTSEDVPVLENRASADESTVAVLPELDPLLMGYRIRDRYLEPRNRDLVFDRSGNATSTVLVNGMVTGVWDVTDHPQPAVRILLFDPHEPEREAILASAADVGAFWFGRSVPVIEFTDMVPLTKRSGWIRKPLDGARPVTDIRTKWRDRTEPG